MFDWFLNTLSNITEKKNSIEREETSRVICFPRPQFRDKV